MTSEPPHSNLPNFSVECVWEVNFYTTWKFYVIGPIFVLTGLSALFRLIYNWLVRLGANVRQLARYKDRCVQLSFWMIYILYPATTRACFQMINCREFDPGRFFLVSDFRVTCNWTDERYMRHYPWACFFAIVYPLGIPGALWWLLRTRRDQRDEFGHGWTERLRLVTKSYSEGFWWFEVYEVRVVRTFPFLVVLTTVAVQQRL